MYFRLIKIFVLFSFLVLSLTGCASGQLGKSKTFNHNAPLIKEDIKKSGTIEVDKTVELGDLLLQVIYHSVIAAEKKKFNIFDVIDKSVQKMRSRHPHIFLKDNSIKSIEDVNNFWEQQKKKERKN